MPHWTSLVTLLALLAYFYFGFNAGRARAKSGVKAPAMVGDPAFERALRVQMNTLEWLPIFLPALWLAALYVNDAAAAGLGLVWIVGRLLYSRGYAQAADKRGQGFTVQLIAAALLWIGALFGVIKALI